MAVLLPLLACFAAIQPTLAWDVSLYATTSIFPAAWANSDPITSPIPIDTTKPLSVTPTSTVTSIWTDYLVATTNGGGRAVVNITTKYLIVPSNAAGIWTPTPSLDVWSAPTTDTPSPTIETHYWAPAVVSNPASCTMTAFTYTDSIGVSIPDQLTEQATESGYAMFVTTYVSTISTDLGGQAVTTSVCDVYLNKEAVPVVEGDIGVDYEYLLRECVDPRETVCAERTGGCGEGYPPTAGSSQPTGTSDTSGTGGDGETPTDGGVGVRVQGIMAMVVFLAVVVVL